MLTKIQPGMIADAAVGPVNLNSTGTATPSTILSGNFGWIYQDSYYFDMGVITAPAGNMVALLLQTTQIDFNQTSLGYDAGSIV